jgi:putative heme-binding domain-containing protein
LPDPDPKVQEAGFRLPPGAKVNLFAADPMISKPVQMNWDARGRLWLVSSPLYPHIEPGQEERDQVLVLEDTDRNGAADRVHVYAEGLHIPTAILPGDGGAYVANSTELLFLPDADGDLRADRHEVMLSGFGTEDTHHLIHTFAHGPEGLVHFNQSIYIHSHVETPWGVRRLLGGGIWEFRPETRRLEILAKGLVNPWGLSFDEWGQLFATDGAGGEGINFVFPRAVFVSSPGASRIVAGLNPGSPKHCSLERLEGSHVPDAFRGCLAAPDFRGHRINLFRLEREGSTYRSVQQPDLIASTHRAFRPIDVCMGPDGAVYVADWYNPIIQHGEVDFRDPRRDKTHGRIWRITFPDRPLVTPPDLAAAPNRQLLDHLLSPEPWTRDFARRELRHRGRDKVGPDLDAWTAAAADDRTRLQAVWANQSLNRVPEAPLRALLASPEPQARAAALRVLYQHPSALPDAEALLERAIADEDGLVRLWAISALAQRPSVRSVGIALAALDRPLEKHLDFALWSLVREHQAHWLPAFQAGTLTFTDHPERLLFAARALGQGLGLPTFLDALAAGTMTGEPARGAIALVAETGGPAELARLLALAERPGLAGPVLAALADANRLRQLRPEGDLSAVIRLLVSPPEPAAFAPAAALAGSWKLEAAREALAARLRAPQADAADLRAAAEAIRVLGGPASVAVLEEVASGGPSPQHRGIAVGELAKLAPDEAATLAVVLLRSQEDGKDPIGIFDTFLRQPRTTAALEKALAGQTLPQRIAVTGVQRASTTGQPPQGLIAALQAAGQLKPMTQQLAAADLAALVRRVAEKGNAALGEAVYRRAELQCMVCHAIGGAGGKIGPDLISIGSSAPVDYLIESLLDPNAKIKEGYHTTFITTKGGAAYTGGIHAETKDEVVLRDALGTLHRIPKADIASQQVSPVSMMPAGLTAQLREDEFVDLVRFLSELGKEGPFKLQPTDHVRSFTALLPHVRVRDDIGHYGAAIFAEAVADYQWIPFHADVSGKIPVRELPEQIGRGKDRFGVLRFEVTPRPGQALLLDDLAGVEVFAGAEPVRLPKSGPGTHPLAGTAPVTFTVVVNTTARPRPLEIRVGAMPAPGSASPPAASAAPAFPKFEARQLHRDHGEALAVGDLNGDGKPDIVAAERYYLNPGWEPKLFRRILPFGKDYLQDNGDHLWDVDGDGDLDVVSGQFTETKVLWFENPGPAALAAGTSPWEARVLVDTGAAQNEISFLRDLTGDGKPEWIANSWVDKNPMSVWFFEGTGRETTLRKAVIAESGNGHGQGFGDINGDGREDIVFKNGWYERPETEPWSRPWTSHPDFTLPHASCPILVLDVNGDGRNDLVWGDGHNYGLFWEEQLRPGDDGATLWRRHVIDQSWSQAHALAWEDLDNDGVPELITGKRYYAHSGKDPGAEDPIVLAAYAWDRKAASFRKHEIHRGQAGTGLQIRVADLDGNGWKDLAVPGKSGTHILWNRGLAR